MKRLACVCLGVVLTAAVLAAAVPDRSKIYTTPFPPPREALDRLNLQMAWRLYVPMDGCRRDGLATVQIRGSDLFVQTRSGLVAAVDAESGVMRWRTRVGLPYRVEHPVAFNSREVYVVNSTYVYALDRFSGTPRWQSRLPEGISAPPIADENLLFIAAPSGRFTAYYLPHPELPTALAGGMTDSYEVKPQRKETEEERRQRMPSIRGEIYSSSRVNYLTPSVFESSVGEAIGPQPTRVWSDVTDLRLELPVLYTREYLLLPAPNGVVLALGKLPKPGGGPSEIYRFPTDSPIHVGAGHFEDMAYVGAEDANLYALEVSNGRLRWRYTAGTPISRQPAVTEEDIFVVAARNGMTRLDRATGQPMWRIPGRGHLQENNSAADRFLAVNAKYVYAADASGRLLVLERRRGVTLSSYDVTDFVFPIPNEVTDRLYLAANNGLIVCLHDRDYPSPMRHRKSEEEAEDPIRAKLAEKITDPGSPEVALRDMLVDWTRRYPPLQFRIDARAFQVANAELPDGKNVRMPKVENKPLGEVITAVLAKINCTFEVIGNALVILPAPAAAP